MQGDCHPAQLWQNVILLSLFCSNAADKADTASGNKNTFKPHIKFEVKIKYLFQNRSHIFTSSTENNSTIAAESVTAVVFCYKGKEIRKFLSSLSVTKISGDTLASQCPFFSDTVQEQVILHTHTWNTSPSRAGGYMQDTRTPLCHPTQTLTQFHRQNQAEFLYFVCVTPTALITTNCQVTYLLHTCSYSHGICCKRGMQGN